MSKILNMVFIAGCFILALGNSCQKELSCDNCIGNNQKPLAKAGEDLGISLPLDSVWLNGASSTDPDGKIIEWLWTKLSGPISLSIDRNMDSISLVRRLTAGVYEFELTVKDNGGLSAKDTIKVMVRDPGKPNRPPVADAGNDTTIVLPLDNINLDGGGSTDPDYNIATYYWRKIIGPATATITKANAVQTTVVALSEGIYTFELDVTDSGGLNSKDTVKIIVKKGKTICSNDWKLVNASYVELSSLSEARYPAVGSIGKKVIYAGGWKYGMCGFCSGEADFGSSAVDIYDLETGAHEQMQLSKSRGNIAVAINGNKAFFGGGYSWECRPDSSFHVSYTNVDIYDAATNTWDLIHLSQARSDMASASVGSKVLFAGGYLFFGTPSAGKIWDHSDRVDIYDVNSNTWTTNKLSSKSGNLTAKTINGKVYFDLHNGVIDIFDSRSNSWSTETKETVISSLMLPNDIMLIEDFDVFNENIVFWNSENGAGIKNITTGLVTMVCLAHPRPMFFANNQIVFFEEDNFLNSYNSITGDWQRIKIQSGFPITNGAYPRQIYYSKNSILFGGGYENSGSSCMQFMNKVFLMSW